MTRQDPRVHRGEMAHYAGLAAEDRIAQVYARRGCPVVHKRWRGKAGEIDLILRDGATLIFIEVKKSSSFDRAASRISRTQMERIYRAAEEFAGKEPLGLLTDMRFDVALVDSRGAVKILENAFAGY